MHEFIQTCVPQVQYGGSRCSLVTFYLPILGKYYIQDKFLMLGPIGMVFFFLA
jgi:hypothetical protein